MKWLNSPVASFALRSIGVDPVQYRLLLDLFSRLGERQEFEVGAAQISLRVPIGVVAAFNGLINLVAAFGFRPPLKSFVSTNYLFTAFFLVMVLATEAINTFLNPVEASVLAHQPVRERCYFAAKLTYLATVVAIVVFPINVVPALAGLNLSNVRWFYPLAYLVAVYLLGLFIALVACGIMGLMMRLISPARVRGVILWMQVGTFGLMGVWPQLVRALRGSARLALNPAYSSAIPMNWFVAIALTGSPEARTALGWPALVSMIACAIFIFYGIGALTKGYMTRVHSLLRSGTNRRGIRSGWIGEVVRKLTKRPSGRAAFSFFYSMARTDWQFRRTVYPMLIQGLGLPFLIWLHTGFGASPFRPGPPPFSHMLPHLGGLSGLIVCSMMTSSDQYRGAWIFLLAPFDGIRSFVRGFFWAVWSPPCAAALILMPVLARLWGIADAALFVVYSVAVISLYVSLELFLVDGLPFASPPIKGRGGMAAPLVLVAFIGAFIIVGLQWVFIFQSRFVTLGATLAFAGSAYVIGRHSLRNLEVNVKHSLHIIASGRATMFQEIN